MWYCLKYVVINLLLRVLSCLGFFIKYYIIFIFDGTNTHIMAFVLYKSIYSSSFFVPVLSFTTALVITMLVLSTNPEHSEYILCGSRAFYRLACFCIDLYQISVRPYTQPPPHITTNTNTDGLRGLI